MTFFAQNDEGLIGLMIKFFEDKFVLINKILSFTSVWRESGERNFEEQFERKVEIESEHLTDKSKPVFEKLQAVRNSKAGFETLKVHELSLDSTQHRLMSGQ